ncbi:prolactin-releasing peptide receptor-like isoform X2 [Panulirus ornatus]|uniref:prolactin-releasing peptide receptor-like isoform X2 n=1 Tax=Panulirus ornatus TaxID=150431 RepID=UPI003A844365
MPSSRVSQDHAPVLLDLHHLLVIIIIMLTSNASSTFPKGVSILKTLMKTTASRTMAEEDYRHAFDNSSSVFTNGSVLLGLWEEQGEEEDEGGEEGGGGGEDGFPGGRKMNLTRLKMELDLSAVYPSLEAVSGDVQVFLIFVYSLAAVLSLVGNVTVILVLAFGRRSSVRCYLINLAVSDIMMATFCIPFSYTSFMFHRWVFEPEFCRIVAFMQHVSVTCSVYTLVAIGVDRYKALIHPLNSRWTKSRARLVIGGIWVFSVVISIVPLVVSDSERYDWDGEWYYECKENWPTTQNELYEKTYTVALFVLTFALPVLGLGYTYLSIVGMMCSYRIPGNAEPSRDQQHFHAKVKVINMMVAVMACFVLSWFPLQVLQFLIYFAPEIMECRGQQCFAYYMSFFTCHWIAMANSFMNPFIYCFMSNNFREDLLQFIRKCGRKRLQRQRSVLWSRSDPGSSFRSILYITPRTSVQSSSKTSFRARSERHREGDTLELKCLRERQSPLRTSRENSPACAAPTPLPGRASRRPAQGWANWAAGRCARRRRRTPST